MRSLNNMEKDNNIVGALWVKEYTDKESGAKKKMISLSIDNGAGGKIEYVGFKNKKKTADDEKAPNYWVFKSTPKHGFADKLEDGI